MIVPRYRQLADELKADINSGRYLAGALLPPEMELCVRHAVSRHTMRDAIRLLREAGLVERRRGSGTRVIAPRASAFVQPLGGVEELLQYARDARLQVRALTRRLLTVLEAERLRTPIGGEPWLVVEGFRIADGSPMALSTIFVPEAFADLEGRIADWDGAVQELIAAMHGVTVARIEQEIRAELLDAAGAKVLRVTRDEPALRTVRRYYAEDGAVVLVSDSVHPASRFVYAMTYRREGQAQLSD